MDAIRFKIAYLGKDITKEGLKLKDPSLLDSICLNLYSLDDKLKKIMLQYQIWDLNIVYYNNILSTNSNVGKRYMCGSHAFVMNPQTLDSNIEKALNDFIEQNDTKAPIIIIGKNTTNYKEIIEFPNLNSAFDYFGELLPRIHHHKNF